MTRISLNNGPMTGRFLMQTQTVLTLKSVCAMTYEPSLFFTVFTFGLFFFLARAAQSLVSKLSAVNSDFEPLAGVFASMGSEGFSMEM